MKRTLVALMMLAGAAGPARADGRVVEQSRNVGEFTGVHVASGIQVKIVEGAPAPIGIRGEEEAVRRLRFEIKDSVLHIGYEPDSRLNIQTPTQIAIRMPRASSLAVSGGSRMEASVPAAEDFAVSASGGGELRVAVPVKPRRIALNASGGSRVSFAGLDTEDAAVSISGAARVAVAGRAERVVLQMSGAAGLDATGLASRTVQVAGSGGSEAAIRADQVSGALSGGSRLHVPASADTSVAESGGSQVSRDL